MTPGEVQAVVEGSFTDNRISDEAMGWSDALRRSRGGQGDSEIVHACPPDGGGLTPCCGKTPFELPRTDRMTLDPSLVTCIRSGG